MKTKICATLNNPEKLFKTMTAKALHLNIPSQWNYVCNRIFVLHYLRWFSNDLPSKWITPLRLNLQSREGKPSGTLYPPCSNCKPRRNPKITSCSSALARSDNARQTRSFRVICLDSRRSTLSLSLIPYLRVICLKSR